MLHAQGGTVISFYFTHLIDGIKQVLVLFFALAVNLVEELLSVRPGLGTVPASDVRLHLVPVLSVDSHSIQEVQVRFVCPAALIIDHGVSIRIFVSFSSITIFILFCRIFIEGRAVSPLVSIIITYPAAALVDRAAHILRINSHLVDIDTSIG